MGGLIEAGSQRSCKDGEERTAQGSSTRTRPFRRQEGGQRRGICTRQKRGNKTRVHNGCVVALRIAGQGQPAATSAGNAAR